MKKLQFRFNLLLIALIGVTVVVVLAVLFGVDHANLVIAVAGALAGGLVGVMRKLIARPPNPGVPTSVVMQIIGGEPPGDEAAPAPAVKINLLIVAFLGAVLIAFLAVFFGVEQAALVIAVAGALVGGLCAVMHDLVSDEPDPDVPASVVARIIQTKSSG